MSLKNLITLLVCAYDPTELMASVQTTLNQCLLSTQPHKLKYCYQSIDPEIEAT